MYTFKGRRIFRFISENGKKPWKNAMNDVIKAQKQLYQLDCVLFSLQAMKF